MDVLGTIVVIANQDGKAFAYRERPMTRQRLTVPKEVINNAVRRLLLEEGRLVPKTPPSS